MKLKDKVAVITGASSGIGRAVARNLDEVGVKLVLTARREDRLATVANELEHAVHIAGDITAPDLPQNLIDKALDTFDRCDIVFNNAGMLTSGAINEIQVEDMCRMVRINVEGAFRMAYIALKHFLSTGSGYLLNTSSIVGTKVRPTIGAYSGTKHAIEALTESLRMELAKTDICVACIEPGLVETELHREWKEPPAKLLDIPKPLKPEDIARSVRFMLEQPNHIRIPRLMAIPGDQSL